MDSTNRNHNTLLTQSRTIGISITCTCTCTTVLHESSIIVYYYTTDEGSCIAAETFGNKFF